MTIGAHAFTTADTVTIGAGKLSFTCSRDNHNTSHTYPRSSDPVYNTAIPIIAVDAASSITVNVGVAANVTIAGSGTAGINGKWAVSDIVDHRTFILSLGTNTITCLLYTSPSPRDGLLSRMPSSA